MYMNKKKCSTGSKAIQDIIGKTQLQFKALNFKKNYKNVIGI